MLFNIKNKILKNSTLDALLLIIVLFSGYNTATAQIVDTTTLIENNFPEKGFTISMQDQDKALQYFNEKADYYKKLKDTANYLHCVVGFSYIEQNKGNYNKAFDILWNALPETQNVVDKWPVMKLYQQLGRLYGIYKKDSLSLYYLKKGLEIGKDSRESVTSPSNHLTSGYFSIANQYVRMKQYNSALKFLDSCYIVNQTKERLHFVDAIYGHIYTQKGDYLRAEKYLQGIIPYFQERPIGYLAKVYSYIADLKLATGEKYRANFYYERSLKVIDSFKVHPEIKPKILEELALLYISEEDKLKAFRYMQAAKFMSDSLFNTQSNHNRELFEIKNKYQKDLSKQKELILAQNNLLELKDKAGFRLKLLVGILCVLVIITVVTFRLKYKMNKMVYEQSVRKEKNNAILELKNKELTTNTLQNIEKDHYIDDVLKVLKESAPKKHKELSREYKLSNKKLWDDFNLRFAQVNIAFYERLRELHPSLTQTDLKHCALIKLNFDSKEMSHILAISLHGVHTARSRIRKKMNLSREESLYSYISNV